MISKPSIWIQYFKNWTVDPNCTILKSNTWYFGSNYYRHPSRPHNVCKILVHRYNKITGCTFKKPSKIKVFTNTNLVHCYNQITKNRFTDVDLQLLNHMKKGPETSVQKRIQNNATWAWLKIRSKQKTNWQKGVHIAKKLITHTVTPI